MATSTHIHSFYKKVREEMFMFQVSLLKFGDLLGGWKKFSAQYHKTTPARPKNTRTYGVPTTIEVPYIEDDNIVLHSACNVSYVRYPVHPQTMIT